MGQVMTKLFCSKTNQAVTLTVMIADSGEAKVGQTDRPGLLSRWVDLNVK